MSRKWVYLFNKLHTAKNSFGGEWDPEGKGADLARIAGLAAHRSY